MNACISLREVVREAARMSQQSELQRAQQSRLPGIEVHVATPCAVLHNLRCPSPLSAIAVGWVDELHAVGCTGSILYGVHRGAADAHA